MSEEAANERARRLYRVRGTVNKMLRNRGYNVSEAEMNLSFEDFKNMIGFPNISEDLLTVLVELESDTENKLMVFFPEEPRIGLKNIKKCSEKMQSASSPNAIIVAREAITPIAKNSLATFLPTFRIETFNEAELLIDITEHELVPKHQVLSDDEKKELLKRYKLIESQLPRIQLEDPIARYYGLRRGQVCKIERHSETSGRYITYRVCL